MQSESSKAQSEGPVVANHRTSANDATMPAETPANGHLAALWQVESRRLFARAYGICGNVADAEDALSTAFMQVLAYQHVADGAYMNRCVRNAAIDIRRTKREQAKGVVDVAYESDLSSKATVDNILDALASYPNLRRTIELCLEHDCDMVKVGELRGIDRTTVWKCLETVREMVTGSRKAKRLAASGLTASVAWAQGHVNPLHGSHAVHPLLALLGCADAQLGVVE